MKNKEQDFTFRGNTAGMKIILAVFSALFCLVLLFEIVVDVRFEKKIAACTALQNAGVKNEEIERLTKGMLDLKSEDENIFIRGAYEIIKIFSEKGAGFCDAGYAFQHPNDAPKSAFSIFEYASLRSRLIEVQKAYEKVKITMPRHTEEEWDSMAELLCLMARRVVDRGEKEFKKQYDSLQNILSAKDITKEVAYKKILSMCSYVKYVLQDIDISKLWVLDLAFYDGFTQKVGKGMNELLRVAEETDFNTLIDILIYYPDMAAIAVKTASYLFKENKLDIHETVNTLTNVVNAFYDKGRISFCLKGEKIENLIETLLPLNADELTESDRQNVLNALQDVFQ